MMDYLVQFQYDDNSYGHSLMTANRLIDFVDALDYSNIVDYKVFDISTFGEMKPIEYCGWQPGCLIQFKDTKGNIVLSGYGTDH